MSFCTRSTHSFTRVYCIEIGEKDMFGDLIPEAPNPVTINPELKRIPLKIPEINRSAEVNHPPRPPDHAM